MRCVLLLADSPPGAYLVLQSRKRTSAKFPAYSMNFFSPLVHQYPLLTRRCPSISSLGRRFSYRIGFGKCFSAISAEQELTEFLQYLDSLKNYEKVGVPKDAGTDSEGGFDLGRMSRLMQRLGNPQSNFKAIHIAGTKGKGSTAAFLSNILRAEGYSVGSYTSPHIQTIRERISLGRTGELVSAKVLNCIFHKNKRILDESVELENGCLSHFEVLTAMAFSLFAQEKVDFAVVEAGLGGARDATNIISSSGLTLSVITTIGEEHLAALGGSLESIAMAKSGIIKHGCPLVLGGPFLPHIESILRDKASSMSSPVVLASDSGNRSFVKSISIINGRLCQSCDIVIHTEKDIQLFIELLDLKLVMIGTHQLQNAATATCAALCLRNLGWRISNRSIRAGLEQSFLLGRSQLLTSKDVEALGVPEAMILLDGAHTKESAKALANTIKMAFPSARLALVVAMASDKDHVSFAREFLSGGGKIEAVILTEIDIGGGKSRTTPASLLRDSWLQACEDLRYFGYHENDPSVGSAIRLKSPTVLISETSLAKSIKIASKNLGDQKTDDRPRLVVVTGSLHIVSSVLASLSQ